VSLLNQLELNPQTDQEKYAGSLGAPRFLFLTLLLTLIAVSVDQFAAPALYTTSPLWAMLAGLLLVWRRGVLRTNADISPGRYATSAFRLVIFLAAHAVLVLVTRSSFSDIRQGTSGFLLGGLFMIGWKLCVLTPTVVLLPVSKWRTLVHSYRVEGVAALAVLLTFFPRRALDSLWPWYSQILGRAVYFFSWLFVSGIGYDKNLPPTLTGPHLDVTIIPACSGINGLELFDFMFGLIVIIDWNRLQKSRALLAYFCGMLAMLLSNALRISSFVILGNHGLANSISRYHLEAGWLFFSAAFLVYLSAIYRWILSPERSSTAQT
jgi:exosortase/archaeosortase family protein